MCSCILCVSFDSQTHFTGVGHSGTSQSVQWTTAPSFTTRRKREASHVSCVSASWALSCCGDAMGVPFTTVKRTVLSSVQVAGQREFTCVVRRALMSCSSFTLSPWEKKVGSCNGRTVSYSNHQTQLLIVTLTLCCSEQLGVAARHVFS